MGVSPGEPSRPDLERIRGQLRELGYLKGPLSPLTGWLLAGRGGPSSLLAINLAASLRVGLIGGPLLGIPAAAAVAVANRPHFASPRDLALLGLYLSVTLGLVLAALEFLIDLLLAWAARRGFVLVGRLEQISARVGLLFTAASSLYLASLLREGRALTAGGVRAWIVWSGAALACLGVGHVIGRLTRLGSMLALAAGGVVPVARQGAARKLAGLGAAVFAAAALALVFLPKDWFAAGTTPILTTHPVPGRIIFVGVDGLSSEWLDRVTAEGRAPGLARLAREGARYDLIPERPSVPPAAWTGIATGRPASEHGILGYQAERVPGLSSPVQQNPVSPVSFSLALLLPGRRLPALPVSSGHRRALAVWEILAREGVETLAVNWWATWPALPGSGIVISERAFPRFVSGQTPDRDIAPESLQQALAARFGQDIAQTGWPGLTGEGPAADALSSSGGAIDAWHGLVTQRLFSAGFARVVFLYLPGLDIVRARRPSPEPESAAVTSALRSADTAIGSFLPSLAPDDLLLVLGEPGRAAGPGPPRGILLVYGGRVIPGSYAREVAPRDLAPTLLALAGFPTAKDLAGAPVLDFLRSGDPAALLGVPIESYGTRPAPTGGPETDPFDPELLDRLRSLGYIQ